MLCYTILYYTMLYDTTQGSLFCFALVQPMGYERGLVAWQYKAAVA